MVSELRLYNLFGVFIVKLFSLVASLGTASHDPFSASAVAFFCEERVFLLTPRLR